MNKVITLLLGLLLCSNGLQAQGWMDRRVNATRQRNQQRTIQQNQQRNSQYPPRYNYRDRQRNQRQDINNTETENATTVRSDIDNSIPGKENVITLVTSGTGNSKEEATRNALRSAIEQAFGTFVSANTEVLNDELVKDEIATITSGNVRQFNVLSTTKDDNGLYDVSLQAVVSIGNLTNYAKSKGFQVELAGAEFVMNMKMRELNKKNELAAIEHLKKKLRTIGNNGGLFDFVLEKSEPILVGNSKYGVKLKLLFYGNNNTKAFYEEIYNTISALSLSQREIKEYKKVGLKYYPYNKQLIKTKEVLFDERDLFYLRNDYENVYSYGYEEASWLMPILIEEALQFVIYDNLGNHYYSNSGNGKSNTMIWSYSNQYGGRGTVNEFFHFIPKERIAGVKGKEKEIDGYKLYTPLLDYIKNDISYLRLLHFNPLLDYCEDDYRVDLRGIPGWNKEITETILERNRSKCYYQLEFFILYSEEELYKLKNIAVKSRSGKTFVEEPVSNYEKVTQESEVHQTKERENSTNQTDAIFPGGSGAMMQYISKTLKYPVVAEENGIQGDVIVQFDVEVDGSLTNIQIAKSIAPSLDKEALRVVRNMPKWTPATKDQVAVRSHQTITVPFRLK